VVQAGDDADMMMMMMMMMNKQMLCLQFFEIVGWTAAQVLPKQPGLTGH